MSRVNGQSTVRILLFVLLFLVTVANAVPQAWGRDYAVLSSFYDLPKALTLAAVLATAAIVWGTGVVRGSVQLRSAGLAQWLGLTFVALGALSTAFGIHPATALLGDSSQYQGLLMWAGYAVLAYLLVQVLTSGQHALSAARVTAATGVVVALYDFMQMLLMNVKAWPGLQEWMAVRGLSTLGNPNHLGGFLVVPLILCLGLALGEKHARIRVAAGCGFALIAGALALTQTRGAWLGAIIGLAIFGFASLRSFERVNAASVGKLGLAALTGVGLAFLVRPKFMIEVLQRVGDAAASTGSGRGTLWRESLSVIADNPVLGVGPDSYRLAWYGIRTPDLIEQSGFGFFATEPHNLILTIASTFGVIATLVAVAAVIITFWRSRSAVFNRAKDPGLLPLAAWWAATAGLLVYLMFGPFPVALAVLLFFCLGVLSATSAHPAEGAAASLRSIPAVAVMLVAASLVLVTSTLAASDASVTAGRRAVQPLPHAQWAVRLAPLSAGAKLALAEAHEKEAERRLAVGDMIGAGTAAQEAVAAYDAAVGFSPNDFSIYWEYAQFLSAMSSSNVMPPEALLSVTEAALAVDRYGLGAAMYRAAALESLGRDAEVVALLEDLWALDPERPEPGVLYARALLRTGDRERAAQVLDRLHSIKPADAGVNAIRSEMESATVAW